MTWKIDRTTQLPPFIISPGKREGTHELKVAHLESGIPHDFPISLNLLEGNSSVALISARDRRKTTDDSPNYNRFMCYSLGDGKQIVTTYQIYTFTGPVAVQAWKPEMRELLENVDMEHFDITPDRTPERLVKRHLERIAGKDLVLDNLRNRAEKAYFDMLWNISSAYLMYNGSIPEFPTEEEKAKFA